MINTPAEKWTAIAGIAAAVTVLLKKLFTRKPAPKPDYVTRTEFHQGLNAMYDRLATGYVVLGKKMDSHHHELLTALDHQVTRINELETGLARVDERTKSL